MSALPHRSWPESWKKIRKRRQKTEDWTLSLQGALWEQWSLYKNQKIRQDIKKKRRKKGTNWCLNKETRQRDHKTKCWTVGVLMVIKQSNPCMMLMSPEGFMRLWLRFIECIHKDILPVFFKTVFLTVLSFIKVLRKHSWCASIIVFDVQLHNCFNVMFC